MDSASHNPNERYFEAYNNSRRGRLIRRVQIESVTVRIEGLRDGSFFVHGPRFFYSLPTTIRNLTEIGVEKFKTKLGKYLENIPDESPIYSSVNRNSITKWCVSVPMGNIGS